MAKKEITLEGLLLIKTDSVSKAHLFFSNYFAVFLLMLTFNLLNLTVSRLLAQSPALAV